MTTNKMQRNKGQIMLSLSETKQKIETRFHKVQQAEIQQKIKKRLDLSNTSINFTNSDVCSKFVIHYY